MQQNGNKLNPNEVNTYCKLSISSGRHQSLAASSMKCDTNVYNHIAVIGQAVQPLDGKA